MKGNDNQTNQIPNKMKYEINEARLAELIKSVDEYKFDSRMYFIPQYEGDDAEIAEYIKSWLEDGGIENFVDIYYQELMEEVEADEDYDGDYMDYDDGGIAFGNFTNFIIEQYVELINYEYQELFDEIEETLLEKIEEHPKLEVFDYINNSAETFLRISVAIEVLTGREYDEYGDGDDLDVVGVDIEDADNNGLVIYLDLPMVMTTDDNLGDYSVNVKTKTEMWNEIEKYITQKYELELVTE